jgi:hypothetical protein
MSALRFVAVSAGVFLAMAIDLIDTGKWWLVILPGAVYMVLWLLATKIERDTVCPHCYRRRGE